MTERDSFAKELNDDLHNSALRLLTRRAHSATELAHKLSARGFSKGETDAECARLLEVGLLDDLAFSHNYLRGRANQGFGPKRIKAELAAKGVARDTITQALQEHPIDWNAQRLKVKEKKSLGQDLTDRKVQAKIQRFLNYRGFSEHADSHQD